MSRFVDVPAAAIRERLAAAGFKLLEETHVPGARWSSGEEIYVREHDKDSRYTVKVYSSIQRGENGARECGADAIRVVALLTTPKKVYPIFKSKRVHRTGSVAAVLERMVERMREAYAVCSDHRKRTR